ncbi:glucose-1-phosphate cytidylyltransferase [Prochlorococcus sp. HOT_208_60]|nr:glucose-1-phosphate cytidylyltransferase [Prochlorococcus sp. HOT_208_60]
MQAVILAGGLGTRLSEETANKPKPMVEIGGKPILWHILKIYSSYGINEFIICCGYKGYIIKEYFANYFLHNNDVTLDLANNSMEVHSKKSEPWKITLIDTGEKTLTGGRLARVKKYINGTFCFTYGDGVADINLRNLISHHINSGKKATLTAVKPPGRFGALEFERGKIISFQEKPEGDGSWINGGFFVLEPSVIDLIDGDSCTWEQEPLKKLAQDGELNAFNHRGFWQPMDTLRDKNNLERLWIKGNAPWKSW